MARPEPWMNATAVHSKARLSLKFSDPVFLAGEHVTGKMELECRAEKSLGIADIKVELFGIQELTSREHSATNTFLHLTRQFQGEGLPPSNAVHPYPQSDEEEALPVGYYEGRKGRTTFFFRFPLPPSSPGSVDYSKGLAKLKYEVRASVGVAWRMEMQRVVERKEIVVVEGPASNADADQMVVAENGRFWARGRLLNPYVVAGRNSCLELFVKNYTGRPTTSLDLSLTRHLQLPTLTHPHKSLQASDVLTSIPFEGSDYIVQPGTEGIANLVFDVPRNAVGVRAGRLDPGEDDKTKGPVDSIFGLQLILEVKIGMGLGFKDTILTLPTSVTHPAALRLLPPSPEPRFDSPPPFGYRMASPLQPTSPYNANPAHFPGYMSPSLSPPVAYPAWSPPPVGLPYEQYVFYPPPPNLYQVRPASADPYVGQQMPILPVQSASPISQNIQPQSSSSTPLSLEDSFNTEDGERGKGERASRVSAHLRMSSRNRSASPPSHRFPQPHLKPVETSPVIASQENYPPETSPTNPLAVPRLGQSHGSPLTVITTHLNASPKSDGKVHSPRPILSPQQSYSGGHDTAKSEHVADLERMAAEEVDAAGAGEGDVNKTLPRRPDSNFLPSQNSDTLDFPSEPLLQPVLKQTRSPLPVWDNQGGLDALERKLLEQVGTRKFEVEDRVDVRSLLPKPIAIPPPTSARVEPPNDSAISSLALGPEMPEDVRGSHPGIEDVVVREGAKDGEVKQSHDRIKRKGVKHRKEAATGRVVQWLGGLNASPDPPNTSTPSDPTPDLLAEELSSPADIDPHPLLRTPISKPVPPSLPQEEAIPERSSGFVLHTVEAPSPTNMQLASPLESVQTRRFISKAEKASISPQRDAESQLKPVLRRFAASAKQNLSDAKYDVRSARGGRGGQVASVGAIWASKTAQQESSSPSGPLSLEKRGVFNPVFRQPRPKAAFESHNTPKVTPRVLGQSKPLEPILSDMNVGDLTARRAKMIKSPSLPAVVSSSLATPVLSSTASLARPLKSPPSYPNSKSTYPLTSHAEQSVATKSPPVRSPAPSNAGFGQARLKDLIKKYQQGF